MGPFNKPELLFLKNKFKLPILLDVLSFFPVNETNVYIESTAFTTLKFYLHFI